MNMLLLTAMHSGAGKTVMSCAILAALKRRGLLLQAFKCGPDYIDPMFHESVLGIPTRNLDLYLQGGDGIRRTLSRARRQSAAELGIAEGAMGYYDGLNGTVEASAWETGKVLGAPAVLILRPQGSGVTLAAQVRGMMEFRPESGIRALLLSECRAQLADYLKPVLERETGLPVLGFLPPMPEANFESRHLGLLTAAEVQNLPPRLERLSAAAEEHIELDCLCRLAEECRVPEGTEEGHVPQPAEKRCRIAVARDEAFCFTYADNLDALREAGAELCFFSPLRDAALPDGIDGLYLPGGYPELYAEALAENTAMRVRIAASVSAGMPTVAECGGFLYLQEWLEDVKGKRFPMCGVLPGTGVRTGKLQRFGYQKLKAEQDSLLFRRGEELPAHEFHYWDSTAPGASLQAEKADGRSWCCAYTDETLYAGFPHLHFDGGAHLAKRFERACEAWRKRNNS